MKTDSINESKRIAGAIEAWTQNLGAQNVVTDDSVLDRYARTTQDRGTRPSCVLYPRSTAHVQAVTRTASTCGVVVYPISRGKNWGYGDACAPTDGAAIVDLSRMNRIVEVDAELGYAVIEPGVSQQQLYTYLRDNSTGLWMDCTGAGVDASLVGNTLDRGFGHTRYGDHFLTACGMEVVLADGRVLETGLGHYANARAARVYRQGIGPFLDGIFCQSNLGIVTKLGLWLMPEPEAFSSFIILVDEHDAISPLVDSIRRLRMAGILQSTVHIANDLRLLSGTGFYPWEETGGQTPIPQAVRDKLRRTRGYGAWNVAGSLCGTKGQVKASRAALKRAVRTVGKVMFFTDAKLALAEKAAGLLSTFGLGQRLAEQIEAFKPNHGLLKGIPTDAPLLGVQWGLRHPHPDGASDPLELGCGLLWVSPLLPMTGRDAIAVLAATEPILAQFGFDPLFTFSAINERAMIAILNVAFDKADAAQTERAAACYDALNEALIAEGYIPYRVGLRGMAHVRGAGDTFWEVAAQLKAALDPKDVIARGRYIAPLSTTDEGKT